MDNANNAIGVGVGQNSWAEGGSDTWGYIMNRCEGFARDYKLYGLNGVRGGY
jgi:hypothetical protein